VITEAEYNARRDQRANERERRRERLTNSNLNDPQGLAYSERMRSNTDEFRRGDHKASRIKRDTNEDGFITRAEFDAATEAMFTRLDANADGVLTEGEGRKKRRGKRRFWKR